MAALSLTVRFPDVSKRTKTLAAIVLAAGVSVAGDASINTAYEGRVVRIIDSDNQEIRMSVFPGIEAVYSVRSLGIDTPEKFRPDPACKPQEKEFALEATRYVQSLIKPGDAVRVSNVGLGKYAGRVTGLLWFQSPDGDWLSLSQDLKNREFAYEYWGGTKQSWCKILESKN